jgi:hypothetical protein
VFSVFQDDDDCDVTGMSYVTAGSHATTLAMAMVGNVVGRLAGQLRNSIYSPCNSRRKCRLFLPKESKVLLHIRGQF